MAAEWSGAAVEHTKSVALTESRSLEDWSLNELKRHIDSSQAEM